MEAEIVSGTGCHRESRWIQRTEVVQRACQNRVSALENCSIAAHQTFPAVMTGECITQTSFQQQPANSWDYLMLSMRAQKQKKAAAVADASFEISALGQMGTNTYPAMQWYLSNGTCTSRIHTHFPRPLTALERERDALSFQSRHHITSHADGGRGGRRWCHGMNNRPWVSIQLQQRHTCHSLSPDCTHL